MKFIKIILVSVLLTACGSEKDYKEIRVEDSDSDVVEKCWDEYQYPINIDCRYYPKECFELRRTIRVCENRRI